MENDNKIETKETKPKKAVKVKGYQPQQGEERTVILKTEKGAAFDQNTGEKIAVAATLRIQDTLFKNWLKTHQNLGYRITEVVYMSDEAKKIVSDQAEKIAKDVERIEGIKPATADEKIMKEDRIESLKSGIAYLKKTFL